MNHQMLESASQFVDAQARREEYIANAIFKGTWKGDYLGTPHDNEVAEAQAAFAVAFNAAVDARIREAMK